MSRKQASSLDAPSAPPWARSVAVAVLAVVALAGGVAAWSAAALAAHARHDAAALAARTLTIHQTVHATNVNHQGDSVINDRGHGTGNFDCEALLHVVVHYTKGTATMTCSTSSWSVTSSGAASFFLAGNTATFTGTMTVLHGTGKYAHASGKVLVEGTWQRKTFAMQAVISGTLSY